MPYSGGVQLCIGDQPAAAFRAVEPEFIFLHEHWSKATHVHSLQTGKVAHTAGQKQKKTGS
jgi:hypothetical protein